jgi:SAM-dependent methyltransferase
LIGLCRFCESELRETFADLGMSPLSNSFIAADRMHEMEPFYPLHAYVCGTCRLVQLQQFGAPAAIFSDYIYFSSVSETWLRHAEAYADAMIRRFHLGAASQVVEVASNDGYLLQFFQRRGVPVLGIEPAANVAKVAIDKGIPTDVAFFGTRTAERLRKADIAPDLIAANNVMAHVPDLKDFIQGFKTLLKPDGVITVEFPHLVRLMQENQFDTIYHEHFSYFSLLVVERVFAATGLRLFDVQKLPTHGGSLRIFACHADSVVHDRSAAVDEIIAEEIAAGLDDIATYRRFAQQVVETKCDLLRFCLDTRRDGKRLAGYGAPAKGNTLLNYCGIGPELLPFTVDRSPHKQGMLLPGVRIPIRAPEAIFQERPDYVLILPWNLANEITGQMAGIREWGGRFVVPIPRVRIV